MNNKRYYFFKARDYFSLWALIGYGISIPIMLFAPRIGENSLFDPHGIKDIIFFWVYSVSVFSLLTLFFFTLEKATKYHGDYEINIVISRSMALSFLLLWPPLSMVLHGHKVL